MLILTSASFSAPVHAALVYWHPWSVFMISGQVPATLRASFNASMQKAVSNVFEIFQLSTARLCQSMIATR